MELKDKIGNAIVVCKHGDSYKLNIGKRKLKTVIRGARSVVGRSFADSASLEGVPQGIIVAATKALSSIGIGKLHKNDSFEMLYEENRDEHSDRVVGPRVLKYVAVRTKGKKYKLYNWGGSDSFYNGKGESMKTSFLEIPLKDKMTRISSTFGYRKHPILGTTRLHNGVDFAAKFGTEICAAANGVVVRAGRLGGYGLYVRIRHANGFETAYAHLSSISVGVGTRVSQGEVIGRVGCSGLSRGAHLHHEVIYLRNFVDPQKHYMVSAGKLSRTELLKFNKMKKRLDRQRLALTKNQSNT
jgi:murein DD-endopeptidase MepM/ murein hydrolase activator NlpD